MENILKLIKNIIPFDQQAPICVIEICKGYCCENISEIVAFNLQKQGLSFESNGDGQLRCLFHDRDIGICKKYENRLSFCAFFFCDSAKRGFMRDAMNHMLKAGNKVTTNKERVWREI